MPLFQEPTLLMSRELESTAVHPREEHWASLQLVITAHWKLEDGGRKGLTQRQRQRQRQREGGKKEGRKGREEGKESSNLILILVKTKPVVWDKKLIYQAIICNQSNQSIKQ